MVEGIISFVDQSHWLEAAGRAGFRLAVKKVLCCQGKLNGCLNVTAQREMLMDKKIVGLAGAISGLMSLSTAQATTVPPTETVISSAQSFGELLDLFPMPPRFCGSPTR